MRLGIGAPMLTDFPSAPEIVRSSVRARDDDDKTAVWIAGPAGHSVRITGLDANRIKTGVAIKHTADAYIYDTSFIDVNSNKIYGGAIRIGSKKEGATTGITVVHRAFADGLDAPLTSYRESNTDFLISEPKNAPVYLRDVVARRFSDAIVDNKATVLISNATLSEAHRVLRIWPGAEIVIVNSILKSTEGRALVWLGDRTARLSYYNTLWDGQPHPDPALIDMNGAGASPAIVPLNRNPLPEIHPVFAHAPMDLQIRSSIDGESWRRAETEGLVRGPAGLVGALDVSTPRPASDLYLCFVASYEDREEPKAEIWRFDAVSSALTPAFRE